MMNTFHHRHTLTTDVIYEYESTWRSFLNDKLENVIIFNPTGIFFIEQEKNIQNMKMQGSELNVH